jgi:drug/metabolite transporter (DMT)-like permease
VIVSARMSAPATDARAIAASEHTHDARVWAGLLVVYVVWGSTYLAIRIALETLPPFLMAAARFLVAGGVLWAWSMRESGERPGAAEWRAATIVGAALLLGGNGGVVWAERTIPSGVAALLVAVLPLWMALLARIFYGERLSRRALAGLPLGFAGIVLLVGPVGGDVDPAGAIVCTLASLAWASGSLYARRARLPHRGVLSTAMQMLAGGACLAVAGAATGELGRLHPSAFSAASVGALAYLIVMGSLVAFTTYGWLLHNAPTPLVATYAYVNPVVAVALGWALAGEALTPRMVLAGGVIVAAVALIASGGRR